MELWENLNNISKKLEELLKIKVEDYNCIENAIKNAKIEKAEWNKVENVVAIFADLKNSTIISNRKIKRVYAKFLESIGYPFSKICKLFDAKFIDIKGDGGIALFQGQYAEIKAFLAAETYKTFQEQYIKPIFKKNYNVNYSFGIGIAKGDLLVKKVGSRNYSFFVWAGDTINNAALISKDVKEIDSNTNTSKIGISSEIYESLSNPKFEEYLIYSCGCPNGNKELLWKERHLKNGKGMKYKYIESNWCNEHGEEYLNKVLNNIKES